jgi:3-oxoacyl-[acyl-carrier protein] reductase
VEQELKGKTALVTGASRGIGAATAMALGHQGVSRITIQYNSNREGAVETAGALRALGVEVSAIQADLGHIDGVRGFLQQIDPNVDILVNNAGHLVKRARMAEVTSELFDEVMTLNVKSAYLITQAVAPAMIEKKSGTVIFVSSIAARNGGGLGATIYAAAKGAVLTMTKGIARELAPHGVRVNGVSPGTVDNYFHQKYSTAPMMEMMRGQTLTGRLGTNEEIADTILFLCSESSRYIYGQTIEINGGMYMV